MVGENIGFSMPVFWLGLLLAYLFAVVLKQTPLALPPAGQLTAGVQPPPFYSAWGLIKDGDTPGNFLTFVSHMNILNAILTLNGTLLVDALRHLILDALYSFLDPRIRLS